MPKPKTSKVPKKKYKKMPKKEDLPKKKYKKMKKKIHTVMTEYKEGTLPIGTSKKKVTNRKQAIAIALSEARKSVKKKKK